MSSALRELIAFFGVEVDDKKLDETNKKLDDVVGLAERAGAAIGIAFGIKEVAEFIASQAELGAQLAHTSEMLGLSVGDLQAFEYAAKNAGLGAEEADTALRFLNKNLGEAATGNDTAAQSFQKLGVHVKDATGKIRPTQDILADVADGIAKMPSAAEKTSKAMEIFGRAGARMIPLLNKGSKGIEELYGEFEKLGGGMDEEFVAHAEETEHAMNKLSLASKGVKSTLADALLPAFTWIVDEVTSAVSWFREFEKHSFIVQTALGTLAAVSAGLAILWGIMNIEVLLAVAAIALLVLIVDDIYTAFQGGDSAIGAFIDTLFGVGTTKGVVEDLKKSANALYLEFLQVEDGADELSDELDDLGVKARAADVIFFVMRTGLIVTAGVFKGLYGWIVLVKESLGDLLDTVKQLGKEQLTKLGLGELANDLGSDDANAKPRDKGFSRVGKHLLRQSEDASAGDATYVPQAGNYAHNGDVVRHTEINIDVQGGSSPHETGRQVRDGVKHALDGSDEQAAFAAAPAGAGY